MVLTSPSAPRSLPDELTVIVLLSVECLTTSSQELLENYQNITQGRDTCQD